MPGTPDQVDIEVSVTEKITGNLLAGVGYSSVGRRRVQRVGVAAEHLRLRQRARARASTRARSTARISLTLHRAVLDGRRRLAHARALPAQEHRPDRRSSISQYASDTLGGAVGFGVPVTEIDTINFGFRVEHTNLTLFADSPPIYYRLRQRVRLRRPTATSCRGGWARDTRDDILYPTRGRLQSALVEIGLPFGDLAYYKAATTSTSGSGRSTAISC